MKKQYMTFDIANGQATILNEAERRAGRIPCYVVDHHLRRNYLGEISGEYFTIRKEHARGWKNSKSAENGKKGGRPKKI